MVHVPKPMTDEQGRKGVMIGEIWGVRQSGNKNLICIQYPGTEEDFPKEFPEPYDKWQIVRIDEDPTSSVAVIVAWGNTDDDIAAVCRFLFLYLDQ